MILLPSSRSQGAGVRSKLLIELTLKNASLFLRCLYFFYRQTQGLCNLFNIQTHFQ